MTIDANAIILAIIGIVVALLPIITTLLGALILALKWFMDEWKKVQDRLEAAQTKIEKIAEMARVDQKTYFDTTAALVSPLGIILKNSETALLNDQAVIENLENVADIAESIYNENHPNQEKKTRPARKTRSTK